MAVQINNATIMNYVNNNYGDNTIVRENLIKNFPALLQRDYGEANDCTLTSMTACLVYLTGIKDIYYVYAIVEVCARRHKYTGEKGTNPLYMKKIYDEAYWELMSKHFNSESKFIKYVGVNEQTIMNSIDDKIPMVLSLWTDGRNYYKNHSVTIVGYKKFKKTFMIAIQDNWNAEVTYIDFNKLSLICSINY